VPKNDVEAVKWWRRAAEQGLAEAQYILGAMYVEGKMLPQDYVEGYKWLNLAAPRFTALERETRD
jgi:TPR repeat protein